MMLIPFINEKFKGDIWRIEVDSLSDTIFIEVRNGADKSVSFTSINLATGQINFTDFSTPERWLTGMEAGYNGILLLHNYQSPNSPVHKGVIAVNSAGETSWSNYTYAFDHLTINGPVLYNVQLQPKKLLLADVKTGATIRPYEASIDTELVSPVSLPRLLPPSFLNEALPVEPHGNNIHYLEYNNLRIVSLHSFIGGQLKQHLYIMKETAVVYEDLLNADIQKLQPEAFMLYKNSLIYIKNKSELKIVTL